MKQDNSFGNIKNLQKQHRLFTLVHLINSRSQGREIINIVLMTASLIGNMVNFLSLKQVNVLKNHLFVLNDIFNMIFLPILGLIVLQLLIGYFYQIQFFISIQWKIFRFLIYPFLSCYLLNQSYTGSFMNPNMAITLFIIVMFLSFLLTAIFSTQSYVYKKLLHRDLPINFHLLVIETLFYVCSVIDNSNIKITCSLLITILAYNLYGNNFVVLKENSIEFRILCVDTFLLLWAGLVFTIALFTQSDQIASLLIASIPCLLYKLVSDFTRQRAPVPYRAFTSIFDDPDTIYFQQFIDSVQPIIEQIMEYYYSQNKKDFVQTLLISYYYEHSNRCLNMQCPFRNQDYKYELRNMNDSKNMKEVLFKICKKIDYLYYGMYKTWPEHIDLKLSLVQFYIFCFPNKIRALEIISEIQLSKLTLQQEYELFRVKILCQTMNSLQVVGQIKLDERLIQFENLVYLTLNTMMEFWSLFYEQKIDFSKLNNITSKIFPLRQKIQQIFQSRLSQETFSTLQILKLYSMYCGAIQNNEDKAWKINDYLSKLRAKLQQHKEIQYLSFDSQVGLLALSLSQNKLGTIAMVNSQAGSIFNYSKKQFKTIKVNEIMPKTFAEQHDNYLKVFLQNRTKKINSDERRLVGKNKAGYIFPILLQLQRTVSSTGDQLLFIANIKKYKLKQSYVACVTDEEGEICDYSSTFDYLFFKQEKGKPSKNQHKNIQEFIPEFFDPNIEEDENTLYKHFKQMIMLKNYGKIQIQYTVAPVVFPLKQNGGFIVQGKIVSEEKPLQFPCLSMTQSLKTMMTREILSSHKTYYNPSLNRYELAKEQQPINMNDQFGKQFTIPFININDVTDIFGIKKESVNYGQNIKTIRLVKNHFERVEDASQFMSEFEEEKTQSAQTINQIIELKQSIMKEKKPMFMRNIKLTLFILTVLCVVTCMILIGSYQYYTDNGHTYIHDVKHKLETRGYLSEYVTIFNALEKGFNRTLYEMILQRSKKLLINSVQSSPIFQTNKEELLKIVYLQNEANLTALLNSQTLNFDYQKPNVFYPIQIAWYVFFVIFFVIIFITVLSYFLFLNQLESIYQVFMCLEQKIIKKLYLQCKNLAKIIELSSQKQKNHQQLEEQMKSTTVKNNQENEEEDQNPVKKVRKFKQDQKFRNLRLFIKLILPFIFILTLSMVIIIEVNEHNKHIEYQIKIHRRVFQLLPETSVFLMNTFLKASSNETTLVSQNFQSVYQGIEQTLFYYQKTNPGHVNESFFLTLLDNVCHKNTYSNEGNSFCKQIIEGGMTVGFSKSVNYLVNRLTGLRQLYATNPSSRNLVQDFNELILLEYELLFPLVRYMATLGHDQLDQETDNFQYEYSTMTIVVVILMGLNFLYFMRYPAYEIEEKLFLSKGLIDLLPAYYKSEQSMNKEGYAKLSEAQEK